MCRWESPTDRTSIRRVPGQLGQCNTTTSWPTWMVMAARISWRHQARSLGRHLASVSHGPKHRIRQSHSSTRSWPDGSAPSALAHRQEAIGERLGRWCVARGITPAIGNTRCENRHPSTSLRSGTRRSDPWSFAFAQAVPGRVDTSGSRSAQANECGSYSPPPHGTRISSHIRHCRSKRRRNWGYGRRMGCPRRHSRRADRRQPEPHSARCRPECHGSRSCTTGRTWERSCNRRPSTQRVRGTGRHPRRIAKLGTVKVGPVAGRLGTRARQHPQQGRCPPRHHPRDQHRRASPESASTKTRPPSSPAPSACASPGSASMGLPLPAPPAPAPRRGYPG